MNHPDGSVTVSFKVAFNHGRRGQRRAVEPKPVVEPVEQPPIDPTSVPGITRMLVLGYHFERLVRDGKVKNYAEIARLTGLSRARVTQLTNLSRLRLTIQERILLHEVKGGVTSPGKGIRAHRVTDSSISN